MTQHFKRIVVIGGSAGAVPVIVEILAALPADFPFPILIVVHCAESSNLPMFNNDFSLLSINEISDKMGIKESNVYVAPCNYHVLLETPRSLSLSMDEKVNYCRPSIDVLFYNVAEVYADRSIAILLSGASDDGSKGLLAIKRKGGLTIVQNPEYATVRTMPQSAIDIEATNKVFETKEIIEALKTSAIT